MPGREPLGRWSTCSRPLDAERKGCGMEVLYPHCAGLDVHKKTVVACVTHTDGRGRGRNVLRTFSTETPTLLELVDWLTQEGITHIAMEATGSYWKPVYNLLEATFTTWVINPAHYKNLPGRKTDIKDAQWIADLLRHGLLRPSFIPDKPQRELRELTRQRTRWVEERSREVNRIQKVLEGANIKLASVVSDVLGVSGRAMLEALIAGEQDPAAMAALARGTLKKKHTALVMALTGAMGEHQRYLLRELLNHVDELNRHLERLDAEITRRLKDDEALLKLLTSIPGVDRRIAEAVIAELGRNLDRFPSAEHLAAWAGLAPGQNESAGKRRNSRTRKGNKALRVALVLAAWAASHTKGTFLSALFHRWVRRMPKKKALVALVHRLLVLIYHVVTTGTPYHELGATYHDTRDRDRMVHRMVQRLHALGYQVAISRGNDGTIGDIGSGVPETG